MDTGFYQWRRASGEINIWNESQWLLLLPAIQLLLHVVIIIASYFVVVIISYGYLCYCYDSVLLRYCCVLQYKVVVYKGSIVGHYGISILIASLCYCIITLLKNSCRQSRIHQLHQVWKRTWEVNFRLKTLASGRRSFQDATSARTCQMKGFQCITSWIKCCSVWGVYLYPSYGASRWTVAPQTQHISWSRKMDELLWPPVSRTRLQKRRLRMINQSTSIAAERRVCEQGFRPLERAQVSQWTHTEHCWDLDHAILQRSSGVATAWDSAGFKQARCGRPGEAGAGGFQCVCVCIA